MQRPAKLKAACTVAVISGALLTTACTNNGSNVTGSGSTETVKGNLDAAGGTFPANIYIRWFKELQPEGINVNYQAVGSGAGIRQFTAQTVDFGASDAPMTKEQTEKVERGVIQIPMTAGGIAVAYNNPDCELKLNQEQLAGIFLGKIKNYKELGCNDKAISVVHRSDGSGTTFNFTKHLSAISKDWENGPGTGKSVSWPTGIGAKGNEGVSAQVNQIDGGLGYVEMAYVKNKLKAASLQNASGEFVKPTNETESEALGSIDLGPELIGGNPNPAKGYPIVTFTWVLAYEKGNGEKTALLKKVFNHMLSDKAQAQAPELSYVSLPPSVIAKSKAAVERISK